MKREYPDCPLVGVGAVVLHEGRAVLVERGREPLKGQWSIPGGALEIGETLRQCAERKAQEETGLLVEAGDIVEVFDAIYREPDGRICYHYVLIDIECRLLGGELRAGGDAVQVRWVTLEELAEYEVAESARKVISRALSAASGQGPAASDQK